MKALLKAILSALGLLPLVRRLLRRQPHGHVLMVEALHQAAAHAVVKPWSSLLIEIGSTREDIEGQGSTAALAGLCHELTVRFYTVDMDPANYQVATDTLRPFGAHFRAICGKGEDFLSHFPENVDFLYLDAFDFDHPGHSRQRRRAYLENLGTDINDQECWEMHLACCKAIKGKMQVGSVIVFDDVWREGDGWGGKGKLAVPHLLGIGFEIRKESDSALWLMRVKVT